VNGPSERFAAHAGRRRGAARLTTSHPRGRTQMPHFRAASEPRCAIGLNPAARRAIVEVGSDVIAQRRRHDVGAVTHPAESGAQRPSSWSPRRSAGEGDGRSARVLFWLGFAGRGRSPRQVSTMNNRTHQPIDTWPARPSVDPGVVRPSRPLVHQRTGNVPRLALSLDEAAASLGVSRDHFDRHILPRVRTSPVGRRRLVAVRGLERFLGTCSI
jgi:hypothetical protein